MLTPLKAVVAAASLYAIYDDTNKQVPKNAATKWVRISVKHRNGSRASLGRADGKGKHTQSGFVFVEIFTPREDGLVDSDVLSAAFADSFRSAPDGDIWYKDVSETEVGENGNWFKTDVIAEFEYDLIQ
jgi:hypothetical protein